MTTGDERVVVPLVADAAHVAVAELHGIDRQGLDGTEGGVVGGEVVDGERDAGAAQGNQDRPGVAAQVEDGALGDLEAEGAGPKAVLGDDGRDQLGESFGAQLLCGDVEP